MTDLTAALDALDRLEAALPGDPTLDDQVAARKRADLDTIATHLRTNPTSRSAALDRAIHLAGIDTPPDDVIAAARTFEAYLTGVTTNGTPAPAH